MNGKIKRTLADLFLVLFFAAAAIVLHAVMPSPGAEMDASVFDSVLVKKLGFPAVASGYFIVLFFHILIVVRVFAPKSQFGKWKTGYCFGLVFSLLYLGGMQEVMVSASPLTEYGLDFVLYELFLGLGDALPAFLLCIALCLLHSAPATSVRKTPFLHPANGIRIAMVAAFFFAWRMIGYLTGIMDNELSQYPVPAVVWTAAFGVLLGLGDCLMTPFFESGKRSKLVGLFLTIGVNWIWFNCYIGLIAAHTFGFMVLRAGADVLAMLAGGALAEQIILVQQRKRAMDE